MADWIYFSLVGFACAVWLVATLLFLDKHYRAWKWNRKRGRRKGYVTAYEFFDPERALSANKSAEASER